MFPLLKKKQFHIFCMNLFIIIIYYYYSIIYNKSNNRVTRVRRVGLVKLTQSEKLFMPVKIARNYVKGVKISCQ